MKSILHILQAVSAIAALEFLRLLPMRWSAAFGTFLFRYIGPLLPADGIARRNLARAFPEKSQDEINRIIRGVWNNLGRGAGEWARLDLIDTKDPEQVEVIGDEHMIEAAEKGAFVIIAAHLGNWEVGALVAHQRGLRLANIYRPARNPLIERYVRYRRAAFTGDLIPKQSTDGMRRLYKVIQNGGGIGVMIDQKLNEGVPVPFFGHEAMTAPLPANIALRWRCPIIPVRYERLPGSRFRVTICPPLEIPDTGDKDADRDSFLRSINTVFEEWIREKPEDWFWVHRRWPYEKKKKKGRS